MILKNSCSWGVCLCLVSLLWLAGCNSGARVQKGQPTVAVTIAPTASLVRQISSGQVQTLTLLPKGNAPEMYEPTTHDLVGLSSADAYLYVGELGFELAWLERISELFPKVRLVPLGESCAHPGEVEREPAHRHDPHYWTSIRGIRLMAQSTFEALKQLYPEQDSLYRAGYAVLEREINNLKEEVDSLVKYSSSRGFVIYHPALTDFAEEFGLEQLAIEQQGKDPTPAQLQTLIERARALRVKIVFIQQEFDQKLARSIAQELGATVVMINPLGEDWRSELRTVANALVTESDGNPREASL